MMNSMTITPAPTWTRAHCSRHGGTKKATLRPRRMRGTKRPGPLLTRSCRRPGRGRAGERAVAGADHAPQVRELVTVGGSVELPAPDELRDAVGQHPVQRDIDVAVAVEIEVEEALLVVGGAQLAIGLAQRDMGVTATDGVDAHRRRQQQQWARASQRDSGLVQEGVAAADGQVLRTVLRVFLFSRVRVGVLGCRHRIVGVTGDLYDDRIRLLPALEPAGEFKGGLK